MKIVVFALLVLVVYAQPKGPLVLVGGGLDDENRDVYHKLIELSGGNNARIGVVTAASGTSKENGDFYVALFRKYGVRDVAWIPIDVEMKFNADNPDVVALVANRTGYFFGGGDQSRLVECFYSGKRVETGALKAMKMNWGKNKAMVGGTSAGTTIMQSTGMVTGGESYYALKYGAFDNNETIPHVDALTYNPDGGFGFFEFGLDTHFSERGRQGRLIRLGATLDLELAFGIDENTALIVTDTENGIEMEVIGENGVSIFDFSNAWAPKDWSITNVKASYLTSTDRFLYPQFEYVFPKKSNIEKHEEYDYATTSNDIFSSPENTDQLTRKNPREFTNIAVRLTDSSRDTGTHGFTYEQHPSFLVNFQKQEDFTGFYNKKIVSYETMTIDILSS